MNTLNTPAKNRTVQNESNSSFRLLAVWLAIPAFLLISLGASWLEMLGSLYLLKIAVIAIAAMIGFYFCSLINKQKDETTGNNYGVFEKSID